jgi:hypothetical protein
MSRRNAFKRFAFIFPLPLVLLSLAVTDASSALVDEDEAVAAAHLWYAMELNSVHAKIDKAERSERLESLPNRQVLYLVSKDDLLDTRPDKGKVLAYVVKYQPTGFVVVSGEERIQPIMVFSAKSQFRWDQPERNFLRYFLGNAMVGCWENLRTMTAKGLGVDVHPNWSYVRSMLQEPIGLQEVAFEAPGIYVVWDTAHWNQPWPYNTTVVANNGNTAGIPTGCTATAMAIKMRFHEWPGTGNSSHAYTDNRGTVQFSHSVNFANQSYNWTNMPTSDLTTVNNDVADLMYHCGVAVDMNYEVPGSGAWPTASSMNTYFRYKGTEDRESGYATSMLASIRGGLPVVCSSTGHTVVVDGYRDTGIPYWHLNHGWGGSNDGWYDLDVNFPPDANSIAKSCPYCQPDDYVYVYRGWTGTENGNLQNPYNSLSEGNSAVPADGHLWIKGGRYNGVGDVPVTINKPVTIRSYEGTAIIGDNLLLMSASGHDLSLSDLARLRIYAGGGLRIY